MAEATTQPRRVPPYPLPMEPYFQTLPGCEGFLQAIAEEPDDDWHRLVFADWLEDHGQQPRAEFIRIQIALAKGQTDARKKELQKQEKALLKKHQETWFEGLAHLMPTASYLPGLAFSRGLVEGLTLRQFVELSDDDRQLLDVRIVTISNKDPATLASWLECPDLRQVVELRVGHALLDEAALERLGRATTLTGLRHLNLNRGLVREAVPGLPDLPWLGQLQSLCLRSSGIDDTQLLRLLRARHLPRLRRLELRECRVGNDGAIALAESERMADLEHLDLRFNKILAPGGLALAESAHLRNLVHLDLRANRIGVKARDRFASGSGFPRLRFFAMEGHVVANEAGVGLARIREWASTAAYQKSTTLDLTHAGVTPSMMLTLLAEPAFGQVDTLNLRQALVHPDALTALLASPKLSQLRSLNLAGNRLMDHHLKPLLSLPGALGLEELDLSENEIGPKMAEALLTSATLANLKRCNLKGNSPLAQLLEHVPRFQTRTGSSTPGKLVFEKGIEKDDFLALATCPELADLTDLTLHCWTLGDETLVEFLASPHLGNLRRLTLHTCYHLGAPGVAALLNCAALDNLEALRITGLRYDAHKDQIRLRWPFAVLK